VLVQIGTYAGKFRLKYGHFRFNTWVLHLAFNVY